MCWGEFSWATQHGRYRRRAVQGGVSAYLGINEERVTAADRGANLVLREVETRNVVIGRRKVRNNVFSRCGRKARFGTHRANVSTVKGTRRLVPARVNPGRM